MSETVSKFLKLKGINLSKSSKRSISNLKRKNEVFIIDYFKSVIKSTKADDMHRFRALLLLKELMKTKNKRLVLYNSKKLLDRLYLLALDGPACL